MKFIVFNLIVSKKEGHKLIYKNKVQCLSNTIMASIILSFIVLNCSPLNSHDEVVFDSNINLNLVNQNDHIVSINVLELINNHRLSIDKPAIEMDTLYASAYAVSHTNYMIENNVINHDNFFVRRNGLIERGATHVSENIAYGYHNAESVVNAWLNSNSHKTIIEGDYEFIGFGIKKGPDNKFYYTTIFFK